MASPRRVSRSAPDPFYTLPWNAMIDICALEPLENCSPVQRLAALAFWYMSEVNNGGHFQYFVNKAHYPHPEVISALRTIGAEHSAAVLASALECLNGQRPLFPDTEVEYSEREQEFDLSKFDRMWGSKGDSEINACLLSYLKANESEFVTWAT